MSTRDVDTWMAQTNNPKRDVIAALRQVITSDDRIEEAIKYRAPAFLYNGILAYFHWAAKDHASLIFPGGSEIPADFALLEGTGIQRTARFATVDEVHNAADDLLDIVELWCSIR